MLSQALMCRTCAALLSKRVNDQHSTRFAVLYPHAQKQFLGAVSQGKLGVANTLCAGSLMI